MTAMPLTSARSAWHTGATERADKWKGSSAVGRISELRAESRGFLKCNPIRKERQSRVTHDSSCWLIPLLRQASRRRNVHPVSCHGTNLLAIEKINIPRSTFEWHDCYKAIKYLCPFMCAYRKARFSFFVCPKPQGSAYGVSCYTSMFGRCIRPLSGGKLPADYYFYFAVACISSTFPVAIIQPWKQCLIAVYFKFNQNVPPSAQAKKVLMSSILLLKQLGTVLKRMRSKK